MTSLSDLPTSATAPTVPIRVGPETQRGRRSAASASASPSDPSSDLATRRPLVLVALLGGVVAAAGPLVVCLGLGVVGWFLSDAGAHGTSGGGLRVGALGWLLGHGSGASVGGVHVTAVPLGVTAVAAWACWRVGLRVGESISGHGPDAGRLADGERDLVVSLATGVLVAGYVLVAVLTLTLAATPEVAPSAARVICWSVVLATALGGGGVAVGSGRAATWVALVPAVVPAVARTCRAVLATWLLVATAWLLGAFVVDLSTAANVVSQLHAGPGEVAMLTLVTLLVLPNATLFSGSYLLGPGFAVGTGSIVSPTVVAIGPLPMFPALAALPDTGATPGWTPWVVAVPLVVAAVASAVVARRTAVARWDDAALQGAAGGIAAGVLVGLLAGLAGGAVGPGRMREVGPAAIDVGLHAVTTFGIGGLLGALAMTWWLRRGAAAD